MTSNPERISRPATNSPTLPIPSTATVLNLRSTLNSFCGRVAPVYVRGEFRPFRPPDVPASGCGGCRAPHRLYRFCWFSMAGLSVGVGGVLLSWPDRRVGWLYRSTTYTLD